MITIDSFAERGYRPGLVSRCVGLMAPYYGPKFGFGLEFEADTAAQMARFLGDFDARRCAFWTVRRDDEIVGCAALDGREDNEPQFRWFFLGASVRGHGLGHRLLKRAIDTAVGIGWPALTLYTHASLQAAVHLYEAHGFVPQGELPGPHWRQPVHFMRMVRMLDARRPIARAVAPQVATASP